MVDPLDRLVVMLVEFLDASLAIVLLVIPVRVRVESRNHIVTLTLDVLSGTALDNGFIDRIESLGRPAEDVL